MEEKLSTKNNNDDSNRKLVAGDLIIEEDIDNIASH